MILKTKHPYYKTMILNMNQTKIVFKISIKINLISTIGSNDTIDCFSKQFLTKNNLHNKNLVYYQILWIIPLFSNQTPHRGYCSDKNWNDDLEPTMYIMIEHEIKKKTTTRAKVGCKQNTTRGGPFMFEQQSI